MKIFNIPIYSGDRNEFEVSLIKQKQQKFKDKFDELYKKEK
jgi:hypothetical protein